MVPSQEFRQALNQCAKDTGFAWQLVVVKDGQPVGWTPDLQRTFPLASVTKLLSTWAYLVAVEAGKVSFSDEVGPASFAHLLAHASGLSMDSPQLVAPAGVRRVYSNYGIELAGQHVEERVQMPLAQWIRTTVLEPLSMLRTKVEDSPAYSGVSTTGDLQKFLAEIMAPTLISPQLARLARTPQFPGLPGILPGYGRQVDNAWGYGFEIRDHKHPHWTSPQSGPETFGHFGQSGSFLWVDPTKNLGAAFLGEQRFGEVHRQVWPPLNTAIVAEFSD